MAGRLFWYRRYPRDWRGGTKGMPWDLQGVYSAMVDEIMLQEGPARIDLREFARLGKSNARAVKRMLDDLVRRGKLKIDAEGRYRNGRANHDVETALAAIDRRNVSSKHEPELNDRSEQVWPKQLGKLSGHVSPKDDDVSAKDEESIGQTSEEKPTETTDDGQYTRINAPARACEAPEIGAAASAAANHKASELAAPATLSTAPALHPREAASLARDAAGSSLAAQPTPTTTPDIETVDDPTPSPAEMQRKVALLIAKTTAHAMEPFHAETDADATAQSGGDRAGDEELPQPPGAASGDTGPPEAAEGQAGAGGAAAPEGGEDESPLIRALRTRRKA